jgi:hypothetical protein
MATISVGDLASLDPVLTQATEGPSPTQEKVIEATNAVGIKTRVAEAAAAGPTTRQRTQSEILDLELVRWRRNDPFSVRHIPFDQLREMTTDLMLGFGWFFTVAPLCRADWLIECPDAQLAAAVDAAFRPISTATYLNFSNVLWYGHQPLVKRFKLAKLGGYYRDPQAADPSKDIPIWTSSADALLWKTPMAVNPSHCLPMWDDDGDMIGFKFSTLPIPNFDLISAASAYGYMVISGSVIDDDYALWPTNEAELNFGSIYGSPRTKRAYRYWWCNPPETPILMSDYTLRPLGSIEEGDEIIGWEPKMGRRASGLYAPRVCMTKSIVTAVSKRAKQKMVKVTFESGHVIRCTPNHVWNLHPTAQNNVRPGRDSEWGVVEVGREISRVIDLHAGERPFIYEALDEEQQIAANWLGGLYDGEGSGAFIGQSESHNGPVRERMKESLDLLGFQYTCNPDSFWIKGGREELMRFARLTRPTRVYAMDRLIIDNNSASGGGFRFRRPDKIVSIEPDGEDVAIGLTTTTGNYIAWGLASKNSYWYRWALADRAFENHVDPAKIVYYPTDFEEFLDSEDNPTNQITLAREKAIRLGEATRSGATIALPADFIEGPDGKPTSARKWEITPYASGQQHFSDLDQTFAHLDTLKLRAWLIPEQAFIEGRGACLLKTTLILAPRDHDLYPDGIPMEELKDGQLVWSYNEHEARFQLWPIKEVGPTKTDDVFKLTLDNGQTITGTADHPFMRRDGRWTTLALLKPGDSLMPLYEKIDHEKQYNGKPIKEGDSEPWIAVGPGKIYTPEFRAVGDHFGWTRQGQGFGIHHKDERHANSSIENLVFLTNGAHTAEHFKNPEFAARHSELGSAAMAEFQAGNTPVENFEFASARSQKGWDNGRTKQRWKDKACATCGTMFTPNSARQKYCADHSAKIQKNEATPYQGRIKTPRPYKLKDCIDCGNAFYPTSGVQKRCEECQVAYKKNFSRDRRLAEISDNAPNNHKVVSVEYAGVAEVWDIIMDAPAHCKNYVAEGVVVHNTSSRLIATQLGEVYQESQQLLLDGWDAYVSEHMFPQFIAANFPEKIGTPCRRVSSGLGAIDEQLRQTVLTLIGQVRGNVLPVDMRTLLAQSGIPLLNEAQMRQEMKNIAELSAATGPPVTPPSGQGLQGYNAGVERVGVVRTPMGESRYETRYFQPPQRILLAESDGFMNELPDTPHYRDAGVRSAIVRLRRLFVERYSDQYASFAKFLEAQPTLHLADATQPQGVSQGNAKTAAAAIIAAWAAANAPGVVGSPIEAIGTAGSTAAKMSDLIGKIGLAGGVGALKGARLDAEDFGAGVLKPWVQQRVGSSLSSIDDTVRSEAQNWLEDQLQQSVDPRAVAAAAKEHFADFPATHADRVARTEVRDAYNRGTLEALHLAGVEQVQAHDASDGSNELTDAECLARDGKIMGVQDAMSADEHPNGTLWFSPLSTDHLRVERVDELPLHLDQNGAQVAYDSREEILYLLSDVDAEHERMYLLMLGDQISYR